MHPVRGQRERVAAAASDAAGSAASLRHRQFQLSEVRDCIGCLTVFMIMSEAATTDTVACPLEIGMLCATGAWRK